MKSNLTIVHTAEGFHVNHISYYIFIGKNKIHCDNYKANRKLYNLKLYVNCYHKFNPFQQLPLTFYENIL